MGFIILKNINVITKLINNVMVERVPGNSGSNPSCEQYAVGAMPTGSSTHSAATARIIGLKGKKNHIRMAAMIPNVYRNAIMRSI